MKKLLFIIVSVLFFGCGNEYYQIKVLNESSKTVSYVYNGISDTLTVNEFKFYDVEAYTQPPKDVTDQYGIASIKTNRQDDIYTFIDATPYSLKVINKLPIEVIFKADNFIDDNGSIEFIINSDSEKTSAVIYTSKPNFIPLVDYPIIINWNFINNAINVIIR